MTVWSGVVRAGAVLLLVLLVPTIAGALLDRALTTAPWGLAFGTAFGVMLASVITTKRTLRRIEQLAPLDAEEDTE